MKIYSEITKQSYNPEEVIYVPNILQSFCYLYHGCADCLVDIVCGEDWKLVFVWKRNDKTRAVYDKWCKYDWKDIDD